MVNILDSWAVEGFRDIASLSSWKATAEKYTEDEKPSKVLQMLRTISRDNARTPIQWDDGQKCWILSSGSQAVDQSPRQLQGGQCDGCAERSRQHFGGVEAHA